VYALFVILAVRRGRDEPDEMTAHRARRGAECAAKRVQR
jgi:hypothetical protein